MVGKTAKAGERRAAAKRLAGRLRSNGQPALSAGRAADELGGSWGAATDARLADAYFQTRNLPPQTTPRRRSPLVIAGVSLCAGVLGMWVALGPVHRLMGVFKWRPVTRPSEFAETFDTPQTATRVGVWLGAPGDPTQGCRLSYSDVYRVGTIGYGLAVDYDVDSPHPATAGVWLAIPPGGVPSQSVLSFFIRGDPTVGYSETCVIELQTTAGRSRYYYDGIASTWSRVVIPIRRFTPAPDPATVHDVLVLFEDWNVTRKQGRVYLDEVRLTDGSGASVVTSVTQRPPEPDAALAPSVAVVHE